MAHSEGERTFSDRPVVERTAMAGLAQMWVTFGVKHGLDPEELCAASGFSPATIAEPDRPIPHFWYARLRRNVIARLPEVAVGVELGKFGTLSQFGYFGLAAQHCSTPLDMLQLCTRVGRVMDSAAPALGPRLRTAGGSTVLSIPRTPDDPPEAIEAIFVGNVHLLRALTGHDLTPRTVRFRHRRIHLVRAKLADFLRCPVEFGAVEDAIVFDAADMDRPLQNRSPEGARHFEAQVDRLLTKRGPPFVMVVTRVIEELLKSNRVSQKHVAERLHLSTRTLQRRLRDDGGTFVKIVEEVRRATATRLLDDPAVPVRAVAFAAGYDDVSSFNRVWKRWTGESPSAYRKRLGLSDPAGTS